MPFLLIGRWVKFKWRQICAKIPKRSKIQDPLDSRSGIQVELGSSTSDFARDPMDLGSSTADFTRDPMDLGSSTSDFGRDPMDLGSYFLFFRGTLSVFTDFIT